MTNSTRSPLSQILSGASTTFIIRVIATGIGYVSIVALARWMGPTEYGAYSYAYAWAYLLALPAGLGVPVACVRFIPEYAALNMWPKVRGILVHSAFLMLATSIALALVGIAAVIMLGSRVPAIYRVPLYIALAGLPTVAFLTLGSQIGRSFGWVGVGYSVPQVWHPLGFLLAAGVLMLLGVKLVAPLMVALSIGVAVIAIIAQFTLYVKRLRPRLQKVLAEYDRRIWLRVALPLLLIDAFGAVINYTDVLMIGAYRPPSSVAYYFAAARIATIVTFFFQSVSALVGPRIAELYAQNKITEVQELVNDTSPWIAIPAVLTTIALILIGGLLLRMFGEGFQTAWLALVFLAIGNLVTSITGPALLSLNMTGHQDTTAKVLGSAAIGNVVLNAMLVPRYGLVGAAFATAVSTGSLSLLLVVFARSKLGIRTSIVSFRRR